MLAMAITDPVQRLTRRLKTMAAEALRTGTVTATGDPYPTQNANFGCGAALTVTVSAASRWVQAGIKALDKLQGWALLVAQESGARPTEMAVDVAAGKTFSANAAVQALLDRFRGKDQMRPLISMGEGGSYAFSIDGFDICLARQSPARAGKPP